jgi:beta-N-acetylhexosaminidase
MRQLFVLTAALAILPIPLSAQSSAPFNTPACESWADSVINGMSLERQIAQLLMPPVYAHADRVNWEEVEQWVQTHQIGGVIAMQGATAPYAERLNRLQSRADVPLLVSTDAEWGLGMRIDSTRSWPRSLTFGATADPELTQAIARGRCEQQSCQPGHWEPFVWK